MKTLISIESEKKASSKLVEAVEFIHKPFQVNSSHEADTKVIYSSLTWVLLEIFLTS